MREAAWTQPVHRLWPEATVVYLQGLPTPGRLTDSAGEETGWQTGPGAEGDRDLKFVDAVIASLRADYPIDTKRIFATGHSNGGAFTYLLWAQRREVFAAFAPSAAVAGRDFGKLEPAPVIHIAGEKDELVRFPWQKLMIKVLCRTNQCDAGQAKADGLIRYESAIGAPVEVYVHPGGHRYPAKATAMIVTFFKGMARP
jgi:polyhydroxybutyrate depolymerase